MTVKELLDTFEKRIDYIDVNDMRRNIVYYDISDYRARFDHGDREVEAYEYDAKGFTLAIYIKG